MLNSTKVITEVDDLFLLHFPCLIFFCSSPSHHQLLLMLINLVFSLASHLSGAVSRMLCLFAVPCTYFVLCLGNFCMGHCSHVFACPLTAIIQVFDMMVVILLTYFCKMFLSPLARQSQCY